MDYSTNKKTILGKKWKFLEKIYVVTLGFRRGIESGVKGKNLDSYSWGSAERSRGFQVFGPRTLSAGPREIFLKKMYVIYLSYLSCRRLLRSSPLYTDFICTKKPKITLGFDIGV